MSEFKTRAAVTEKLRVIFCDVLNLPDTDDAICGDGNLVQDLGADSLDQVELVIFTEEAFGFEIPDAEIEALKTFSQFVDLVCAKLAIPARASA
jgi:acyl carrier protein